MELTDERARRKAEKRRRRRKQLRAQFPGLRNCESPIERALLPPLIQALPVDASVRVQVPVGNYRADFLVCYRGAQFVIEADGKDWHSSPEQRAHDAKRDAFMAARGIIVLRFTGSQIFKDASGCAATVSEKVTGTVNAKLSANRKADAVKAARAREVRESMNAPPLRIGDALPSPTKADPLHRVAALMF